MSPGLQELFDKHAAPTLEKQLHLNELVGDLDWEFSVDDGCLVFGQQILFSFQTEYEWSAQILGSTSEESNTWLWSWANEQSAIPENSTALARRLQEFGKKHDVPELVQPQLSLDDVDGHSLAIVAAGVLDVAAYYRGPYDDGATFLLIDDSGFPAREDDVVQRMLSVFPQVLSTYAVQDHRRALLGYLAFHNVAADIAGDTVCGTLNGQTVLTAKFDSANRLAQLSGQIGA